MINLFLDSLTTREGHCETRFHHISPREENYQQHLKVIWRELISKNKRTHPFWESISEKRTPSLWASWNKIQVGHLTSTPHKGRQLVGQVVDDCVNRPTSCRFLKPWLLLGDFHWGDALSLLHWLKGIGHDGTLISMNTDKSLKGYPTMLSQNSHISYKR